MVDVNTDRFFDEEGSPHPRDWRETLRFLLVFVLAALTAGVQLMVTWATLSLGFWVVTKNVTLSPGEISGIQYGWASAFFAWIVWRFWDWTIADRVDVWLSRLFAKPAYVQRPDVCQGCDDLDGCRTGVGGFELMCCAAESAGS